MGPVCSKDKKMGKQTTHKPHLQQTFAKEAISNYLQVEMGVAKRIVLKEDAVPTIYPVNEDESASTSSMLATNETSCPASALQVT